MVNWNIDGSDTQLPAQIWGFVDLSAIQEGVAILLSNGKVVRKGVYAIIESSDFEDGDEESDEDSEEAAPDPNKITSDLFTDIVLETESINAEGEVVERKYFLVNVEDLKEPIVVIPNIGATPKCKYLLMTPKSQWSEKFTDWVDMPHKLDTQEMAPEVEEEDMSEPDEIQEEE